MIKNRSKNKMLYLMVFFSRSKMGLHFWNEITKKDIFGQKRLFG